MAFILDHLTAILVGATLLAALLYVQQHGQQTAVETTLRHRTETQTASFLATLSRDLENARTGRQVETGLGTWAPDSISSWTNRSLQLGGTWERTDFITFVTLADPNSGASSSLVAVGYRAVELPDSVDVNGVRQPLFRVDRYVYEPAAADWVQRGGSPPILTLFKIRIMGTNGNYWDWGALRNPPPSAEITIQAAHEGVGQLAGDQQATTQTRLTQQKITIRNVNAASTGDAASVAPPGGTVEIPIFVDIPPPPPPTTGTPGSTGTTGTGSTGTTTGSGSTGTTGTTGTTGIDSTLIGSDI